MKMFAESEIIESIVNETEKNNSIHLLELCCTFSRSGPPKLKIKHS